MAVKKIKKCQICQTSFEGRRDAKTCSPTCRKRLQRTIIRNQRRPNRTVRTESAITREFHRISSKLLKQHVLFTPLAITDERGSIPVVPIPVNNPIPPKTDVRSSGQVYKPGPQTTVNPEASTAQSGTQVVDTVSRRQDYGPDESLSAEAAKVVSETYRTTTVKKIWGDTISKLKHRQVILVALVFLLLFPLGGLLLLSGHGNNGTGEGGDNGGAFSSAGGIGGTSINKRDKFSVNLTLEAKNTLVVAPTAKPKNLEKGQIYLDQGSDKLFFFDGSKLHDLGATSSIINNIQGPTNITNSTIINSTIQSGVTKLTGTANQINVSSSTGNVTLSLPQDIGTSSTPTFAGLNLGSALQVGYGGTGATSFTANSLLLGNGSGAIQTTNVGSTGDCLIVNGSGVPTFQSCAGGGGVFAGGSQTPGTLTKFDTTTNQIVDSLVSESGSTVSVDGDLNVSGIISGDGSGITALDAGNISSGILSDSRLSGNVTLQGNSFNGASQLVQLTGAGLLPILNGSNLTNVDALTLQGNGASYYTDASNISSGTISDLRLSSNVALLGNDNNFTGANLQHNGNDVCDDSNNCNYASSSGSGNYIQNGTAPQSADFNITGDGTVGGTLTADTVNAVSVIELNGTDINAAGTLSNVAYLDQDNTFSGHNLFQNSSDSTTAFQIQNSAGNSNLFVADTTNTRIGIGTLGPGYSLDVQAGDINTAGIYRVDGAQISSADLSNDSNLAKINGANIFTAANTFSDTVAIQGANSLTLGTASNLGSIIFRDGSSANTATLQVAGALSGDVTFGLPVTTGTQTICTIESGNCAGSGSGITGSGNTNKLAKFTAGQAIGDSSISDDGTTVTVAASQVIQGASGLTIGDSGVNGVLAFKNSSNSNTLTLQSGATTGNLTFTLPTGDGSNGDCLQTNGSGVLAFSACTGGAGGGVTSVNTLTGVLNLVGTANQVDVSSAGDTITLSLPQDINTSGNANFRTITLTGQAAGDNLIVGNAVSGATGTLLDLKVNNVSKLTVDASGNVNTTGQYQVNGAQISSSDLSNDSNLAKLDGTGPQTFTGNNKFTGTFVSQNASDSTAAFQIQNAAGTSNLFVADTTDSRIGIGTASPGYTLDVNGDVNTSGVYRINGVTVCSASGCTAASGSGNYIQNGTVPQTADFNITGDGTVGGTLAADTVNATSTIELNGTDINTGGTLSNVGYLDQDNTFTGHNLFKNSADSSTGFQVQNSAGTGVLTVDTSASRVGIGSGSISSMLHIHTPSSGTSGIKVQDGTSGPVVFEVQDDSFSNGLVKIANSGATTSIQFDGSPNGVNGGSYFKTNSTTAFQIQNSGGTSNLFVADTTNTRLGVGTASPNTTFSVYNGNESTTQTDFTQALNKGGINIVTDYTDQAYTPGIFWSTQDNNSSKPKAGIYMYEDNGNGTSLLFGTSGSYATGITNTALTLGPDGEAVFRNGTNSSSGFQVQNSAGTGLFTVNTSTGAALTSSLYIDTLGSGGTTALCWNGSFQVSTCSGAGANTLQGAYDGGNNLTTTDGRDINIALANTATDPNFILNVATGSTGEFKVQRNGSDTLTIDGDGNIVSSGNIQGGSLTSAGAVGTISTDTNGVSLQFSRASANYIKATTAGGYLDFVVNGNTSSDATSALSLASNGAATFRNGTDSNTAFQVQNSSGNNIFQIDTSNDRVRIGNSGRNPISTLDTYNASRNQFTMDTSSLTSGILNDGTNTYYASDGTGDFVWRTGVTWNGDWSATGNEVARITDTGAATFKNSSDSTTAFQVQNAAGTNLIAADTTNHKVKFYDTSGTVIATVSQSTGLEVKTGGTTAWTNLGTDSGSTNILNLYNSSNTTVASVSGTGAALFKNSSDSTTAFQVQNSSGTTLLNANTSNFFVINNGSTGAGNLLENPGFEAGNTTNGTSGWNLTSTSINNDSVNAHSGNYVAATSSASASIQSTKYFQVEVGKQYYTSVWVKSSAGATGANGSVMIFWYTKDKGLIGADLSTYSAPGTTYALKEVTAVAPSGAVYARVVAGNGTGATGTWYFDDLTFLKTSYEAPVLFKNASNSTSAFLVQDASSASALAVDTTTLNTTLGGDLAINGGDLTSSSTTFNLLQSTVTTLNIGAAVGSGGINLAGGSSSTGCTIDGSNGNLACSGTVTGSNTSLQGAYDGGNTINLSAGTPIEITAANSGDAGIELMVASGNSPRIDWNNNTAAFGIRSDDNALHLGAWDSPSENTLNSDFNINTDGSVLFRNHSDSNTAFQIQNSGGAELLNVDSTDGGVLIGADDSPNAADSTAQGVLRIVGTGEFGGLGRLMFGDGNLTDNQNAWIGEYSAGGGSDDTDSLQLQAKNDVYITTLDDASLTVADFYGDTSAGTGVNAQAYVDFNDRATFGYDGTTQDSVIKGIGGKGFKLYTDNHDSSTYAALGVDTDGAALFRNYNDTTSAFQIQNANGDSVVNVNTSDLQGSIVGDFNVGNRYGDRLFSDNFESGGFLLWDQGTSGTIATNTSTVHDGKYSAQINPSSATGYASATVSSSTTVYARAWIYVSSQTTSNADLLSLEYSGDTANTSFTVFRNSGNLWLWNNGTGGSTDSGTALSTGAWHLIEMRITTGNPTGVSQVWLDGTQVINLSGQDNSTNDLDTIRIGDNSGGRTFTAYIDDVVADTVATGTASSLNVDDSLHVGGSATFGGNLLVNAGDNTKASLQLTETNDRGFNLFYDSGANEFVLQANDAGSLNNAMTIQRSTSAVAFQPSTDGAHTFSVLDSGGGYVLDTASDTSNLGVGTASASDAKLYALSGSYTVLRGKGTGSNNLLELQNNTSTVLQVSNAGNITAGGSATGTTATTNGTGTNTTTVNLTSGAFADGDIIFVDNAGQDYYTRIVSGGGTSTLTVSPAVTYENSRTVTKYNAQYLGSDGSNFTGSTRNNNSYFQGYFTGGIVTGTGSTTYSDGNIESANSLKIQSNGTIFQNSSNSTSAFQIQNAFSEQLFTADTTNSTITYGKSSTAPSGGGTVGSWTSGTSLTTAVYGATSVAYNGYIYNIGGNDGSGPIDNVYYAPLNPTTGAVGSWTNDASSPLPTALYNAASAVYHGYIYVMGGNDGTNQLYTTYYAPINSDGSLGTWSSGPNLASSLSVELAGAAVNNGYVYLVGGDQTSLFGAAWQYAQRAKINSDGTLGSWSLESNTMPAAREAGTVVINNGYIYMIGGGTSLSCSPAGNNTIFYAPINSDGTIGTWTTDSTTMPDNRYGAAGGVWGGHVYIMGGVTSGGGCSPAYLYHSATLNSNGSTSSWNGPSAPQEGWYLTTVTYNGYIYVLGGTQDDSTPQSNVTYASVSGTQGSSGTYANLAINSNSTTAFNIQNSVGSSVLSVDAANNRVGINVSSPSYTLDVSGTARFKNSSNSTTAFLIQNAAGTSLFTTDTTNSVITVAGTTTTFATLTLTNAHFKSTQTTKPTIGTPASCGTSPSATVTNNSTDSAGSITITTGSGSVAGACSTVVTFNKAYGAAPKSVQLTDSFGNTVGSYIGGINSTTFTVNLKGYGAAIPVSTSFTIYYWVIE